MYAIIIHRPRFINIFCFYALKNRERDILHLQDTIEKLGAQKPPKIKPLPVA